MTDRIVDYEDDDDVVSIELGVSRRKLLKQLGTAGLIGGAGGVAGCSDLRSSGTDPGGTGGGTDGGTANVQPTDSDGGGQAPNFKRVELVPPPSAESIDNSSPSDPERRMVLVNQNGENQFWVPCINGLNDALNKLGWRGQMLAPNGYDETKQVEILNTTIDTLESNRDVIGSTIMGPEAYKAPVNKALENDIMFFQWNTTHPDWTPQVMRGEFGRVLPYVGQRSYRSGYAVGVTALEKANDTFSSDTELTMLPTLAVPGHPALEGRIRGVRDAFSNADRSVTIQETLDIGQDISEATSRIQDRYNTSEFNVLCGCGFWGPTASASLVENEGLEGELVNGGFDLVESVISGVRNGTISFTVGQDPYSQGYMPVMLAYAYMDRGVMPKDYVTGAEIIDESNIEFAAQRSGDWPDLRDWQEQNYGNN
ncbi:substrate-binding domain-containing protein [Halosimplex sp. J119]